MTGWYSSRVLALAAMDRSPSRDRASYVLRHGSMRVGLYAPEAVDDQTPHTQDELYIIASGSGDFVKSGERRSFKPEDVFFVEAGVHHKFEHFTPDFTTWVVFWGRQGGEA